MYHALLTNRYLTTRVIPFIAVAAVALCTALVIIVVSVMSGFVDRVREAGKTLMGDVIISYPIRGIPQYERLIAELKKVPEVKEASPVVDSWGLLKMPYGDTEVVQVWAIDPVSFNGVTDYYSALHWRPLEDDAEWISALKHAARERWEGMEKASLTSTAIAEEVAEINLLTDDPVLCALVEFAPIANRQAVLDLPEAQWREQLFGLLRHPDNPDSPSLAEFDLQNRDPRLFDVPGLNVLQQTLRDGETLQTTDRDGEKIDGIVIGMHVSQANERRSDGSYRIIGHLWSPGSEVTLTVLPISAQNRISDPANRIFTVVNEAQFGVYQIDDKRVLIPLEAGQAMLDMGPSNHGRTNPDTGVFEVLGRNSPRATLVLLSAVEGVEPAVLKEKVIGVYDALRETMIQEGEREKLPGRNPGVAILTWEEQNAQIIGPVEKERNLMRILFSIVYFVCGGLVLVIFWAIVYEKTRDIGILRSIGASRIGILWIFVRYGLVVGVIGSVVGLGLAWLVVHNINRIHNGLGSPFPVWAWASMCAGAAAGFVATLWLMTREAILPVVISSLLTLVLFGLGLGMALHQGFLVWDPKVYYFTEIPNDIDVTSAIVTMGGAVLFSVIGALIPAARAGDIDPVQALRYG